ncbi:MAG TPA: class I SAM-dependent methyltransferase [Burkholderiales bacterium]|nr:class I SAM-dependent methyltransferase [Burkholderiales bacterium]
MDLSELLRQQHGLRVERLADGRQRLEVEPGQGCAGAGDSWTTAYPDELILEIYATKRGYVCDEIRREEDPRYVERAIRHEVLGCIDAEAFRGKRILDFGCGAGASTLVMSRLLPPCELVGVELEERLLKLARLRAEYLGRQALRFFHSPSGTALPAGLGTFDYIVLSAVYEHLLPEERGVLLPSIWRHLKPGGVLFINQTPHRYSPLEMHTTGLPLINYLPDTLALAYAKRFSGRINGDEDWPALLRAGIRGATIAEIVHVLGGRATLLAPKFGDQIDLWHGKLSLRYAFFKRAIWAALKALKPLAGVHLVPELTLALRKT